MHACKDAELVLVTMHPCMTCHLPFACCQQLCATCVTAFHRDLQHFKGEQDPFCGDIPNQRVRDSAKEAIEALYSNVAAAPSPSLGVRRRAARSSCMG